MDHEAVFWTVLAAALALAALVGIAVALLPPHGGEDEPRAV
jgi:hypothetical protein